ncbi:MAG: hypothetical protein U0836_18245 [Pirellulales bacterium]
MAYSGGTSFSAPGYTPNLSSYYGQAGLSSSGGLTSPAMYRPVYDAATINRDVNLQQARAMQSAQGQSQRLRDSLMSRGFGSNSPFAISQGQNIMAQARAGAYQDETQRRMRAAEANYNGNFQYDQLRQQELLARLGLAQGQSQQGLQAWQTQYGTAADLYNQQANRQNQLQIAQMQAGLGGPQGIPGRDPGWVQGPWGPVYDPSGRGTLGYYR